MSKFLSKLCLGLKMSSFIKVLISLMSIICKTNGQWMGYFDNNLAPFPSVAPLTEELVLPKDTSNIPIIVLLKPKRAKSLSYNNEENLERRSDYEKQLDIKQWLAMPHINADVIPNNKININQRLTDLGKAFETQRSMTLLPMPKINSEEVVLKGRGDEGIQWPLKGRKTSVSQAALQSISRFLPQFAALSQSNAEIEKLTQSSGGVLFEDALKKFTSNLTDLEHRNSGSDEDRNVAKNNSPNSDDNSDGEDQDRETVDLANEGKSLTTSDDIKIDEITENEENSRLEAEQKDNNNNNILNNKQDLSLESIQKSPPIINERHKMKIPVNVDKNHKLTESQKGFLPISETTKGWLPMINKKPKPKQFLERNKHHSNLKTTTLTRNGFKNNFYGMEEISKAYPGVLRPRRFYAASNPPFHPMFDSRNTIRQLPFNKYATYLTESDISPALHALETHGDSNKPQHVEPTKEVIEENAKLKGDIEEKENVDKNLNIMEEKHINDEKQLGLGQGLGFDGVSGPHQLSCCELLHNQYNGIGIGSDFDEEKLIQNMVINGNQQHLKQPFHHFKHHNQLPQNHKVIGCHEEFGFEHNLHGDQQFLWPQQVYRPPQFRPKFGPFHKPLFWG